MAKKYEGSPEDDPAVRRKKKGLSKLGKKKIERVAGEIGLPPDPVLPVEPEPALEPEIETPEPKLDPELKFEPKPEPEKKEVKHKQIGEERWTKEESNDYDKFVNKYGIKTQYKNEKGEKIEIIGYFPKEKIVSINYFREGKIENREFDLNDFEYNYQEDKYEKVKKEEVVSHKPKRKSQEKRTPTQKNADAFEMSSKDNGNKRVYAKDSTPEDAKERAERIKNEKTAELGILKEDGKKYLKRLQAMDWSKYNYDEEQKKDLIRIELETLLKEVIEEDSKFFKREARKISKDLAKKIMG